MVAKVKLVAPQKEGSKIVVTTSMDVRFEQ
jgi:hypothetical protein